MGQLIDVYGTPIDIDRVTDFRIIQREFFFYPCYEEEVIVTYQKKGFFSQQQTFEERSFRFIRMVPYGAILGERERPSIGSFEIKSFGEAAGKAILESAGDALNQVGGIAADFLHINTADNKVYKVLTAGRNVMNVRRRDIPAKVRFTSGKVSDIHKNDELYPLLGEPIAPSSAQIPALVITHDKHTLVFFGGGFDNPDQQRYSNDIQVYYQMLFEYRSHSVETQQLPVKKAQIKLNLPRINIPKLSVPSKQPLPAKSLPPVRNASSTARGWVCSCGYTNTGKFCMECGSPKPAGAPLYRCDKCGWEPEDPTHPPKFCPECGDSFDTEDIIG